VVIDATVPDRADVRTARASASAADKDVHASSTKVAAAVGRGSLRGVAIDDGELTKRARYPESHFLICVIRVYLRRILSHLRSVLSVSSVQIRG
jgi:hypothetical protein